MSYVEQHRAHLKELRQMKNLKELRHSKYFVMNKSVARHQRGRGSRFQNHKLTTYSITSAMGFWSAAWSPSDSEVTDLIKADYVRDAGRTIWQFNNKRDVDKAWVLLLMKYGE